MPAPVAHEASRRVWILALLSIALLLLTASIVVPLLAGVSRVFDRVADRRVELAGVALVVLAALLLTGGSGL